MTNKDGEGFGCKGKQDAFILDLMIALPFCMKAHGDIPEKYFPEFMEKLEAADPAEDE